jgi:hypothetical protein
MTLRPLQCFVRSRSRIILAEPKTQHNPATVPAPTGPVPLLILKINKMIKNGTNSNNFFSVQIFTLYLKTSEEDILPFLLTFVHLKNFSLYFVEESEPELN